MSSSNTLENIVKMLSSLLLDDKISTTFIANVFGEVNKLSTLVDQWCNTSSEPFAQDVCSKFNEIANKLIELSMKNAIVRAMNNEISIEQDTLGNILTTLIKILDVLKNIILRSIIVYDNKILCKVKKPFHNKYSIVVPGYTILIPIENAVVLASLDYIDIIDVH